MRVFRGWHTCLSVRFIVNSMSFRAENEVRVAVSEPTDTCFTRVPSVLIGNFGNPGFLFPFYAVVQWYLTTLDRLQVLGIKPPVYHGSILVYT